MAREALLEPIVSRSLTLEEWSDLPEDEPGELVDGRLEEEEMPDFVHEVLAGLLARLLSIWAYPDGIVIGSDTRLVIGESRGRKPDLAVYLPGGTRPPRRGLIRVPPDIVVEVVSPRPRDTRRDRVDKVAEYAAFGVRFYWIVDPELRSLEILELGEDGRYIHALGATSGVVDPVPGCEGLVVDLDQLWRDVDRLAPEEGQP